MSDAGIPPPPATFEFLVLSLRMQADLHLGLMGYAKDEAPNLPAARHVIDLLAMLHEKTRGNLELAEQRLVENSLTELRFRFVQVSESAAKVAAASSPAGGETGETAEAAEASPSEGDAPSS